MTACIAIVLGVLLAQPTWYDDRGDTPAQQVELIRPVAAAVCVAATKWEQRLYLMTQAYAETRLARYVLEDRCADGPKGARCDEGLATGPWQVHYHCRDAWNKAATREQRFTAGARCAMKLYESGLRRCGTLEGAFYSNSGRIGCAAPWARARVVLMQRLRRDLADRKAADAPQKVSQDDGHK